MKGPNLGKEEGKLNRTAAPSLYSLEQDTSVKEASPIQVKDCRDTAHEGMNSDKMIKH